jgi:two-component system response regulator FixJ
MKKTERGKTARILVVDDDAAVCHSLKAVLSTYGFEVALLHNAEDLLQHMDAAKPDCILLDLRMPGIDGMAALRILATVPAVPPIIMISAHGDIAAAVEAMRNGAVDFVEKPFDDEALYAKISSAIAAHRKGRKGIELFNTLSPREREVAGLVAKGFSTQAISLELGLSSRTVDHHRARVLAKMEATSLPQLMSRLIAIGLDK